jgi:hypothetical protein
MELDEEYLQTIFDTPLQTKEFIETMGRMEKAAMDDKARKSLEFALKLVDAHTDVPEIAAIADKIKAALGGGGSSYPAPGSPGYGTPTKKEDTKVKKDDLKKQDELKKTDEPIVDEKGRLMIKLDDPVAQAQLENFFAEKDELKNRLEKSDLEITELKNREKKREYMAKAAEFDAIPQDGLGDTLMEAGEKLSPESYEKFIAHLTAENEANKQNKIMGEIGTSKVPEGVAGEVAAGKQKIMAKSADLTEEKAGVAFFDTDPDAYERLEQEKRRQRA